jgi:hypothetical protein
MLYLLIKLMGIDSSTHTISIQESHSVVELEPYSPVASDWFKWAIAFSTADPSSVKTTKSISLH